MSLSRSSSKLNKWGLVQGWLAANMERRIEIRASLDGLEVRVVDPALGERTAAIESSEDPSHAAWRAIIAFARQ